MNLMKATTIRTMVVCDYTDKMVRLGAMNG